MATTCITDYYNCIEGLWADWKAARNSNPSEAAKLRKKIDEVNAIATLYWQAKEAVDETNQLVQCARLRTLFTGDYCIDDPNTPTGVVQTDSDTFTDGDLAAGILAITHSLNTETIISVTIIDPDGLSEIMSFTVIDADNVTVDFGGSIGIGTFTWIVTAAV